MSIILKNVFQLLTIKKSNRILTCCFSTDSPLNKSNNFEEDWFKKLTNSASQTNLISTKKPNKKFSQLNSEEKKQVIKDLWHFRRENGLPVPKELNDQMITELEKCESFTHLGNSLL